MRAAQFVGCFPLCFTPPLYIISSICQPLVYYNSQLFRKFFGIVVSRYQQRTYGAGGAPRRPNPLRGKDLGQQHNTTTLDCQVQIELFLGNPLDVARLTSVEDCTPFHDFGPLMPVTVWGVEDNANDTSRFSLKIFHN